MKRTRNWQYKLTVWISVLCEIMRTKNWLNNQYKYYLPEHVLHCQNVQQLINILLRVSVAPLIIVGSWSFISIYWITTYPCNYSELPQLQGFHKTQPIITLSYIMDTVSGLFSSWSLSEHWLVLSLLFSLRTLLFISLSLADSNPLVVSWRTG
jgi:hypothetical protein